MKRSTSRLTLAPVLVLGLVMSLDAGANDPECDPGTIPKCDVGTQYGIAHDKAGHCPNSIGYKCLPSAEPPAPTSLNCEYNYGGYICEAWPQGENLTYSWSSDGSISIPYPPGPNDAFLFPSCWTSGSGSLTVTITSPFGLSSVRSRSLHCP